VKIVVDASVALKWVLNEPDKDAADALMRDELLAPDLLRIEAANALWAFQRRGGMTADEVQDRLALLVASPVRFASHAQDVDQALSIACRLSHPVYDCVYLALAMREQATMVTADKRFLAAVAAAPEFSGFVRSLT
jgi:predicted nucleic acid-binding protein